MSFTTEVSSSYTSSILNHKKNYLIFSCLSTQYGYDYITIECRSEEEDKTSKFVVEQRIVGKDKWRVSSTSDFSSKNICTIKHLSSGDEYEFRAIAKSYSGL